MSASFEIHYKVERNAYASVIRKRMFRSKRVLLAVTLGCVSGALFYFAGYHLLGIAVASGFCVATAIRCWIAPSRWLSAAPYLAEQKKLRITPEKLFLEASEVKSEVPWNYYIAWNESALYFMLALTADGYCSVIPKSAMSPEQQDLFRNWVAAKIPKYPKRLKRK